MSRPEKRHFVGLTLGREPLDGGVEVLLSQRSKRRIDEKIRELTPRTRGQSLRDCIRKVNEYLLGWMAESGNLSGSCDHYRGEGRNFFPLQGE